MAFRFFHQLKKLKGKKTRLPLKLARKKPKLDLHLCVWNTTSSEFLRKSSRVWEKRFCQSERVLLWMSGGRCGAQSGGNTTFNLCWRPSDSAARQLAISGLPDQSAALMDLSASRASWMWSSRSAHPFTLHFLPHRTALQRLLWILWTRLQAAHQSVQHDQSEHAGVHGQNQVSATGIVFVQVVYFTCDGEVIKM